MKLLPLACLAAAAATAALAQDEPAPADGDRIACRVFNETGSRLNRRRVCMSLDRWRERDRLDRETAARGQTRQLNRTDNIVPSAGWMRSCPTC